ncbi:hypothetical protein GKG47_20155 [Lactonifactor sp. BIOML-A3]|uniref:hypothetical protein n=1 Tax=unclassified Lactonifactor TaxID=2636670 RepID=UPI0012B0B79F|nr:MULTISPECIES: hypothetical protein [unclassified Lactonifactor]MSA03720.1 hypothetical protein [Lactonifactor sp. BIOML-A5]MSA10177.1 hypothetical protein [Lactonifactor sp. BIOML-A4]MSA14727.1 hypothetical protein [Lactonifactor sp. BIOML-A3]MSA19149.1 hypothetical protein [Lactonifactor sp. BIOML-A2]MSA39823.1 hypothetical protein [Lactonifactor sp. BIOML-A1]
MNDELLQQILEAINGTNERLDNLQMTVEGMGKNEESSNNAGKTPVVEEDNSKVEESLLDIGQNVAEIKGVLSDGKSQEVAAAATENPDYTQILTQVKESTMVGNTISLYLCMGVALIFGILLARTVWRKM